MKSLIFDFDGTIADSMAFVRELSDEVLPPLGINPLTDDQIEEMRKMTIIQGFRYLKVPVHKLPSIVIQVKQRMTGKIDRLEPIDGMIKALRDLKKLDVSMGILTSNSNTNVESFLKRHKIDDLFDFVQGGAGLFSKSGRLKNIARKKGLKLDECMYLGDEIRDVEAALAVHMPVIAVGWGINHEDVLKAHNPTHFVTKPSQIVDIVKKAL